MGVMIWVVEDDVRLVQYDRKVLPFFFTEGFNQATCNSSSHL